MKILICFAVFLLGAVAKPEGFYHQEYNYKTSSSSYRNNELQHKADDQGHYSKSGDLEGRAKPKIVSNSEHSEYTNPKLREGYSNGDLLSQGSNYGYGQSNGFHGASGLSQYAGESLSSADHLGGYGGAGGSQYGSSSADRINSAGGVYSTYGSNSQQSYGSSSALRSVASRLQNDLRQDIQAALQSQSQYSHRANVAELENELRRNLTDRLNQLLYDQFGTQTIRGGQSYSLVGGRVQNAPNYEQQELLNLQNQLEDSLLQQLKREFEYKSSHTSQQTYSNQYDDYNYNERTTYRPVYPNLNVITTQKPFPVIYPVGKTQYTSKNDYNYDSANTNVRYTPVAAPLSITTIASNVQNKLDRELNKLLERAQTEYFSESSRYSTYDTESILERLRQELKDNLTYALNEDLRNQYGSQIVKDGYLYSVGTAGQLSNQYNYNVDDLENLKKQVEDNLITKLNRDFLAAKQSWITRQQSQSNQRYQQNSYPTYNELDYHGKKQGLQTGYKDNRYNSISGSHQVGYETSGTNMAELQRQLQTDLSRQLQAAISQNQQYASSQSQSGYDGKYSGGGGGSFEESYQRLYDELQRNLTQQLQSFMTGGSSSGAYSSFVHGGVSEDQLANLRSQLQQNLASQLQQGLQQSYSASASYSASSSGSSGSAYSTGGGYRAARGYGNYDSSYSGCSSCRAKRSYGYRNRELGLPNYSGVGNGDYRRRNEMSSSSSHGRYTPIAPHVGQEEDDSDLTQQVEPVGQEEIDLGQQIEDSEVDIEQVPVNSGFENIQLGSQDHKQQETSIRRTKYESKITKIEQPYNVESVTEQIYGTNPIGQEIDESDLTQQTQEENYAKLFSTTSRQPTHRGDTEIDQNQQAIQLPDADMQVYENRPTLQISGSLQEISQQIENNLAKQLQSTIQNNVLPSSALSSSVGIQEIYQNLSFQLRRNVTRECQQVKSIVSHGQLRNLESTLKNKLDKQLQLELQKIAPQNELGNNRFVKFVIPQRSRKPNSADFINHELNSQGIESGIYQIPPIAIPADRERAEKNSNWLIEQLQQQNNKVGTRPVQSTVKYDFPSKEVIQISVQHINDKQYQIIKQIQLGYVNHLFLIIDKTVKTSTSTQPEHIIPVLTAEIDNILRSTKPELREYFLLIENNFNPRQQEELDQYLRYVLSEAMQKQLAQNYSIVNQNYVNYFSMQEKIAELTTDQYDIVKQLQIQLEKKISHSKTIEEELQAIDYLIEEVLAGRVPNCKNFIEYVKVTFKPKQIDDLKKYLNYSLKAPFIRNQITGVTSNQYELIEELRTELEKLIIDEIHNNPQASNRELVALVQKNIHLLIADVYRGNVPHLKRFSNFIQNDLKPTQKEQLNKYLKSVLTIDLKKQLIETQIPQLTAEQYRIIIETESLLYEFITDVSSQENLENVYDHLNVEEALNQTPRGKNYLNSIYQKFNPDEQQQQLIEYLNDAAQIYCENQLVKKEIPNLSEKQENEILELTAQLRKRILEILNHQINTREPTDSHFEDLVISLDGKIDDLIEETVKTDLTFSHEQKGKLEKYLQLVLKETLDKPLVSEQVPNLTNQQFHIVKELDEKLVNLFDTLIIEQSTHEPNYDRVFLLMEEKIPKIVSEALTGSLPDTKQESNLARQKLNPKQQQELKKYLENVLRTKLRKQLALKQIPDIKDNQYHVIVEISGELRNVMERLIEKEKNLVQNDQDNINEYLVIIVDQEIPRIIQETLNNPKYSDVISQKFNPLQRQELLKYLENVLKIDVEEQIVKAQVSDLTKDQYKIVQGLNDELKKQVINLVEQNQVHNNEAILPLENLIAVLIRDSLAGKKPELQSYSMVIEKDFNPKQKQELNDYLENSLLTILQKQLTNKQISNITDEQYEIVQLVKIECKKRLANLIKQHKQEPYSYLTEMIDEEIKEVIRDNKSKLKQKFRPEQQEELNKYLEYVLPTIGQKQLATVQIPNLTNRKYCLIHTIESELQVHVANLIKNHQQESPDSTYKQLSIILDDEIDEIVNDAVTGKLEAFKKYEFIIPKYFTSLEVEDLKKYLKNVLKSSVKQQTIQNDLPYISSDQWYVIKDLDTALKKRIGNLIKEKVQTLPQQSSEAAYQHLLVSLEEEIENLIRDTVTGETTELQLKPYSDKIQEHFNLQQREKLYKQLREFAQVTLQEQLTFTQVSDLTNDQQEVVKDLDAKLQKEINELIEKHKNAKKTQNPSNNNDDYGQLLFTLEAEIQNLVQGALDGSKPEYRTYYTVIQQKFNPKQKQQLNDYLENVLKTNVKEELTTNQIPHLTIDQRQVIRGLNAELQERIDNLIIENQQKLADGNRLPQDSYNQVREELEAQIADMVKDTLSGANPDLNKYYTLVETTFNPEQQQQLNEYLQTTLSVTLQRQLIKIYKIIDVNVTYLPYRQTIPNQGRFEIIKVRLENLTSVQFNIIKQIESDFTKQIETAVSNGQFGVDPNLSSYQKYQIVSANIEKDIKEKLSASISGSVQPGQYYNLVTKHFESRKIPDVEKYIQIRLIKNIRENLSKLYGVERDFGSSSVIKRTQHYQINYGTAGQTYNNFEDASEIEPLVQVQYAKKGIHAQNPVVQSEIIHQDADVELLTENYDETTTARSWWSKFGNKVKNLKQKIVGR